MMELSHLSPDQQIRYEIFRDFMAVDPETALERALTAWRFVSGMPEEMPRTEEKSRSIQSKKPAVIPAALLAEPVALQVVKPAPQDVPKPKKKPLNTVSEKAMLFKKMCEEGASAEEIREQLGWTARNSPYAAANQYGLQKVWREAREARAKREGVTAPKVKEPVAPVRAAGHPVPAPTPAPVSVAVLPPVISSRPSKDSEAEMIAAHIKEKGVTRAVDFGVDQPAVDALRETGGDVVRSRNPRQPWLVNGASRTTPELWKLANADLVRRGKPTIRRGEK